MIKFPTVVVDNFYNQPDKVRDFALRQQFNNSPGNYPGKRTNLLHELNRDLFDGFCNKLFSIFYPGYDINWIVMTSFWKVSTLDSDPLSPKNMGWIHTDGCLMAGVVYLSDGFNKKLGTTIYEQIKEKPPIDGKTMHSFYSSNIDEGFDENITKNNSSFEESVVVGNQYNRLICFDGNVPHSPSHYYMGNETRLVQVFFVKNIESNVNNPMQRIRNYDNIPYDSL